MIKYSAPKMEKAKQVTVKSLADGGLNLADRARHIGDSESPDMLNFWRKGGQLRLRPGLRRLIEQQYGTVIDVYPRDGHSILIKKIIEDGKIAEEKYGVYFAATNAVFCYDGQTVERVACSLRYDAGWVSEYTDMSLSKCMFIPSGSAYSTTLCNGGHTWTASGEKIYLIGSGYFLEIKPQVVVYENPTAVAHITACCLANTISSYVPVLYTDCTPDGKGTKAEEHNIISNKCIQKFTTDAKSNLYCLCDDNLENTQVTAIYIPNNGSKYIFSFPTDVTLASINGIMASLDRKNGTIYFTSVLVDAASKSLTNNLAVTYSKNPYTVNPVCTCTAGTWYDGGTQTKASCSRLFLSGSVGSPNRIYYCDANNPAYFPENCYVDIGAPADPITAFGIQYDILAVFKKNSVYSLSYTGTTDPAAFTVKEVHSSIGCDMPATLRLASNALIWGSSTGGIYALKSTAIKDERAVRLLSKSINEIFLSTPKEQLCNASAICDGTSYLLLAANRVFILNYESMQFKGDQSTQGEAWFIWNLPENLECVFRFDSYFAASSPNGTVYLFDENEAADCGKYFDAYWYSKNFDFGLPEQLKKLCRFTLTFGCSKPVNLEVCFCDGPDESRHVVTVNEGGTWEKSLSFRPAARWSENFSIGVRRTDGAAVPFSLIEYTASAVCGAQAG